MTEDAEGEVCEEDDDPCQEWYEEMIGLYVAINQGIVDHDDLTKQQYNNSARTYNANCVTRGYQHLPLIGI